MTFKLFQVIVNTGWNKKDRYLMNANGLEDAAAKFAQMIDVDQLGPSGLGLKVQGYRCTEDILQLSETGNLVPCQVAEQSTTNLGSEEFVIQKTGQVVPRSSVAPFTWTSREPADFHVVNGGPITRVRVRD